jgi:hypothetical protein
LHARAQLEHLDDLKANLVWGLQKLDTTLASNAGVFDGEHLTAHERESVCDGPISYDCGKCLGPRDFRAVSTAAIRTNITMAHACE